MSALTDNDLLTIADVARLLHCSKAQVCRVMAGTVRGCSPIPLVALGRRKLVRRETLLAWINTNEHTGDDATIPASLEIDAVRRA